MYYILTRQLKNIIKDTLRECFDTHPKYKEIDVQTSYVFKERPSYAIVVNSTGTSFTKLSADQQVGHLYSYAILARILGKPCTSIEWIKEDKQYLDEGGEIAPAGKYFIEIISDKEFELNIQYKVFNEVIIENAQGGEYIFQLQHKNVVPGTLSMEAEDPFTVFEEDKFEVDYEEGIIRWTEPGGIPEGWTIRVTYEYLDPNSPKIFNYEPLHYNNEAIPGIILAFGDRIHIGDKQVVIVQEQRSISHYLLGGKSNIDIDCEIVAQDLSSLEEITDLATMYLWGLKRDDLYREYGVFIDDISIGGESAEVRDDTAGELEYRNTVSLSCICDWEIAFPLPRVLSVIWPYTRLDGPDIKEDDLPNYTPTRASTLEVTTSFEPFIFGFSYSGERII